MIINESILKAIEFLKTHNKNYTMKQYEYINYLYDEIEEAHKQQLKQKYKNVKYINYEDIPPLKIFDDLYNIGDKKFKKLYNKAKKLYYEYTKENNFKNENCFISSSCLHGFFTPNLKNVYCICFIDEKPILIYRDQEDKKDA